MPERCMRFCSYRMCVTGQQDGEERVSLSTGGERYTCEVLASCHVSLPLPPLSSPFICVEAYPTICDIRYTSGVCCTISFSRAWALSSRSLSMA